MTECLSSEKSLALKMRRTHDAYRVELPQTAVEWADENFYLSAESSGTVGRWTTLPFQVAILNAMGSPDVPRVVVKKSARVGYTKLLLASVGYFTVKKKRSVAFWQPTDGGRDEFVKDEVNTAIRDVPVWRNAFPAFGKKSSDNTIDRKAFLGAILWIKGATSSKNFERISPDVVVLDEIDRMPLDIDGEGTAEALSWKRAEVSSFRKQILGSSPKEAGSSQVEAASERADAFLQFNVECPHCGEFSPLEFGGKDSSHGFKWEKGKPETVLYHCRECGAGWPNSGLDKAQENGFYLDAATGYSTKDGIAWRKDGEPCSAPRSVAFHVWSAYSPYAAWREIIEEWVKAQADPLSLKTFVNTTLGETWDAQEGEHIKPAQLKARPRDEMPTDIQLVTASVDTQPDRWEVQFNGFRTNGDLVVLGYEQIPAEVDRLDEWKVKLLPLLDRKFDVGKVLTVEVMGVDTGGSNTATAYDFCALYADRQVLALKGAGGDRPFIGNKPSRNWRKVGLDGWIVGTNAGKDLAFSMLVRTEGDGRLLFPEGVDLPANYFDMLTAEKRVLRIVKNRKSYEYQKRSASVRNEALDLTVYGLFTRRWAEIHRGVDLMSRSTRKEEAVDYSKLWGG